MKGKIGMVTKPFLPRNCEAILALPQPSSLYNIEDVWLYQSESESTYLIFLHVQRLSKHFCRFSSFSSCLCTEPPKILPEKWTWLSRVQLFATPWTIQVHGILQARMLEWAAFPFYRGSSWPRDWTQVSRTAGGFFFSWANQQLKSEKGT